MGKYSLMLVHEFYIYVATITEAMPMKTKPFSQPKLTQTMVCEVPIDLSEAIICRFLFGLEYQALVVIAKLEYRLGQVRDRLLIRDATRKGILMRWIASHIVEQG